MGCSGTLAEGLGEVPPATARPLGPVWGPSTELAMSSSREVAASNLYNETLSARIQYALVPLGAAGDCMRTCNVGKRRDRSIPFDERGQIVHIPLGSHVDSVETLRIK